MHRGSASPIGAPHQEVVLDEPGIGRYHEIAANPNPEAQCGTGGDSGTFGYFGKGSSLAGGANGYQTGINNSAVCGNRQGNLP